MAGERPFSYMATAVAFGGQTTEPHADLLDVQAATVLPPSGGRGSAHVENYRYGQVERGGYVEIVSIDSAYSEVLGSKDKEGNRETLTSVTVTGLSIAGVVRAKKILARLISIRKPGSDEPPFYHEESRIDGLWIKGPEELKPDPDDELAQCDTFTKAVQHHERVKPGALRLTQAMMASRMKGGPFPDVMLQMSIFRPLPATASSGAKPGECSIEVPGGTVSLGELEITPFSRRLTMLRVTMRPNLGGVFEVACVSGDGREP